jgi:adenylate cyclase class 2
MNPRDLPVEMEVKFYLLDKAAYENRLRSIGAKLERIRTHESNYRFDTPEMSLSREHRVLRLRQDNATILTYKGPAETQSDVSVRPEIEFEVSDFTAARQLLEALGYVESVRYEKWRTVYALDDLEITLDEMPFGNFTEIEGQDARAIQQTATVLALDWSTRITSSYMVLFDRVRKKKDLIIPNLTFEDFRGITVSQEELDIKPADKPLYY